MQGRFKRDGSASAEPETRGGNGGTGPMAGNSSPQHAQNPGPSGNSGARPGRPGASTSGLGRPGATPSGPAPTAPQPAPAPVGPGSRIALRNWRISTRLVSLLALPVVAATSLGALRINQSMEDIQQLDNMKLLTDITKQATELAAALQEERDQSAGPLAHGANAATDFTIKGYRAKTDRAREDFYVSAEQVDDAAKDGDLLGVRDSLIGLYTDLNNLDKIRANAYESEDNSTQTVEAYHRLISHLLKLSQDMADATSNPEMIQRTRALAAFSSAKEYASIQRAVIAAALPASNNAAGDLSENDRLYAESAMQSHTSELRSFKNIHGNESAEELLKPVTQSNPTIEASDTYANRALSSSVGMESLDYRSYRDWVDDSSTKIEKMQSIEHTLLTDMEQKARELRRASEQEAIISGALILLVLGVSLVGAFVVARSMIRSLRRLEETATRVAQDRLPELVKQLSESDPQDVDTSVESVGVHSRDEIGRVAAAFDDVHREAVRLAAEQALLRGNVNAMFTNLSRRSQGLIQRQLSLISELESREADPDQLSSLFKLDHLATRMRRNGENLLVLAGEEPGRRWTRPVPLVDVLRAAASEVEQYERIELAAVPTTEVAGRVVNDLVHLLAELLENATSFSSPQTKVKVTGHALPDGRVLIEIHDTGIGLSPEDLAAINERLASPPTVDVSVSRRMGLFVVGRLSQRHGIRIQLRPSDSGGTTALVMLPVDVAQGGKLPQPKPGQQSAGGPAAAQASAGAAAARRSAGQGGGPGGALGSGGPGGGALGSGGPRAGALGSGSGGPGAGGGALGSGRPGAGALGAGASGGGRLGAAQGPRAELPSRDSGRPVASGPGGARGPQGLSAPHASPQDRPAGAGADFGGQAPVAPQGMHAAGPNAPQDPFGGPGPAAQQRGGDDEQGRRPQLPPRGGPRAELPGGNPTPSRPAWDDQNSLPPVPRASLDTPRGHDERDLGQTPGAPGLNDVQGPGSTAELPVIASHDERHGPGSTAEFARPDFSAPAPGAEDPEDTEPFTRGGPGQYVRPDVFGAPARRDNPSTTGGFPAARPQAPRPQAPSYDTGATGPQPYDPAPTGPQPTVPQSYDAGPTGPQSQAPQAYDPAPTAPQSPAPQAYDPGSTGQFAVPGPFTASGRDNGPAGDGRPLPGEPADPQDTGEFRLPADGPRDGADFGAPRPPAPQQRPARQEPEALPPAGPGDGRTPLFDTLETNWFHGAGQQDARDGRQGNGSAARQPQSPTGPQRSDANPWRSSPNDDLVRQAERVRQPAAGGVTTSGLPRRVPRANLVPGTAQQQPHQSGPQVSRTPDDVRGRLTNLRRGIAQGRQAGTGQTGSFPRPTHQQER